MTARWARGRDVIHPTRPGGIDPPARARRGLEPVHQAIDGLTGGVMHLLGEMRVQRRGLGTGVAQVLLNQP
jgi:hypothetical protein